MKKYFLLVIAMVIATMSFAQGSFLATLSHDGQISVYYGASALSQALEAADNGDVITLSSGQFNAADITKAITLRGAGMSVCTDSLNSHEPTIIQGSYLINIPDSLDGRIILEGLYMDETVSYSGNLQNCQFLKCRFLNFTSNNNGSKITNSTFIHCRFSRNCIIAENSSAYFVNSIICGLGQKYSTSNIVLENCFVKFSGATFSNYGKIIPAECKNAFFKNCILTYYFGDLILGGEFFPTNCVAYNCVGIGSGSNIFYYITSNNTNIWVGSNIKSVFKTYSEYNNYADISDLTTFELTDEAKTKYLGTDGTQVGLYGGSLAYDENPATPKITKCHVASKSTADGKLGVEIEVKAAEY